MYQNIKTCIKKEDEVSGFFNCEMGVKQGENLSPLLFSIYLNDLEDYLRDNNIDSLEKVENMC